MTVPAIALRRAFLATSVSWVVLLALAPWAVSRPAPAHIAYAFAFALYGIGSVVCHQLPDRSFHLWAIPVPVCARCTGIYAGAASAAIVATLRTEVQLIASAEATALGTPVSANTTAVRRSICEGGSPARGRKRDATYLLALATLPSAATLIYEWTAGHPSANWIRGLAGLPVGAAIAVVIMSTSESSRVN